MKRFPLLFPLVFLALPPRLATVLPILLRSNLKIVQERVARRNDLKHPDYFSFLLPEGKPAPSDDFLVAQANHLIVGGLDPDTNLFTAAIHYLLENPETYDRLKDEIRGRFLSWDQMSNDAIQPLPYIHAVIEETLRLHTNGAFGLPRISPGATVDGHYIAKGVSILVEPRSSFADGTSVWYKQPLSQSPTQSVILKTRATFIQSDGFQQTISITTARSTRMTSLRSNLSPWGHADASDRTWHTYKAGFFLRR